MAASKRSVTYQLSSTLEAECCTLTASQKDLQDESHHAVDLTRKKKKNKETRLCSTCSPNSVKFRMLLRCKIDLRGLSFGKNFSRVPYE